jgi:S1-C subfamily serine protease
VVIGVNTLYSEDARNIGFAIPINAIKSVIRSLRESGRVVRPWLGVQGRTMDPGLANIVKMPVTAGYLVEVVEDDSPAEEAGLRGGSIFMSVQGEEFMLGGDIVTGVNGVPVRSQEDFSARVKGLKPGQRARLTIFREGVTRDIAVGVAERPRLPYDLVDE